MTSHLDVSNPEPQGSNAGMLRKCDPTYNLVYPDKLPIRGAVRPIHRDTETHMPLSDLKSVFAEDIADQRTVKEDLQCL